MRVIYLAWMVWLVCKMLNPLSAADWICPALVPPQMLNFVPVPGQWGTLPLSMKGAPNGTASTEVYGRVQGGSG